MRPPFSITYRKAPTYHWFSWTNAPQREAPVPKFCRICSPLFTEWKWHFQMICVHLTIFNDGITTFYHFWSPCSDNTVACFALRPQNCQTSQLRLAPIWNQQVNQSPPPSTSKLLPQWPLPWVRVVRSPRVAAEEECGWSLSQYWRWQLLSRSCRSCSEPRRRCTAANCRGPPRFNRF